MFHRRLGSNTYESSHHQSWFRFCLVNSGFLQGSPGKEKHINQPNHEGLARFSEFLRLEKKQKVPYLFQQGILPKPNAGGLFLSLSLSIDNYCPAWQGHIEDSTRTYVWQHNGKVFVQGHTANSNQSWGGVSNQRLNFGSLSGLRASSVCCDRSGFLEGGPPVRWLSFQRQTSWVEWGLSFQSLLTEKKRLQHRR